MSRLEIWIDRAPGGWWRLNVIRDGQSWACGFRFRWMAALTEWLVSNGVIKT